jgi:hypothetical protein
MNIDWSKAPEGATHFDPVDQNHLRQLGGIAQCWNKRERCWIDKGWQYPDDLSTMPRLIARPVPWNGEGLPPVGTICAFCRFPATPEAEWQKVKIVAHWSEGLQVPVAVFMSTSFAPQADQAIAECFRPIRTAEQIEAEERDAAYKGMVDDLSAAIGISNINRRECDVMHALAEAGYRKQVQP